MRLGYTAIQDLKMFAEMVYDGFNVQGFTSFSLRLCAENPPNVQRYPVLGSFSIQDDGRDRESPLKGLINYLSP